MCLSTATWAGAVSTSPTRPCLTGACSRAICRSAARTAEAPARPCGHPDERAVYRHHPRRPHRRHLERLPTLQRRPHVPDGRLLPPQQRRRPLLQRTPDAAERTSVKATITKPPSKHSAVFSQAEPASFLMRSTSPRPAPGSGTRPLPTACSRQSLSR